MDSKIADALSEILKSYGTEFDAERIDDRYFAFRVFLFNDDGRFVRIRRGSILDLALVDSFAEFHHRGTMVIKNPEDVLERTSQQVVNGSLQDMSAYRFRGDCRDFLYIEISPLEGDVIEESKPMTGDVYSVQHLFAIYDVEDLRSGIPGSDKDQPSEKLKKLSFHDYKYQLLLERNSYYSTGQFNKKNNDTQITTPLAQMSDTQRERHTGDIIKDIITSTCPEMNNKFSANWDKGITKSFYTASAQGKAVNDIEYMLQSHLSTTGEKCILRLERTSEEWSLLPMSTYFDLAMTDKETAGPWLRERLVLDMQSTLPKESIPGEFRVPHKGVSIISNLHFPDISVVSQYLFYDSNGLDTQGLLTTRPVHFSDYQRGTFRVSQAQNEIESVRDEFQRLYVDNLPGSAKGGARNNILIDDSRRENKNITVSHSRTSKLENTARVGKSFTLMQGLLKGNAMSFVVKGDTTRKSGRFFSLDRDGPYFESDYDDKILGIYLITNVVHKLTPAGYTNEVTGIKPYSYTNLEFNEAIR